VFQLAERAIKMLYRPTQAVQLQPLSVNALTDSYDVMQLDNTVANGAPTQEWLDFYAIPSASVQPRVRYSGRSAGESGRGGRGGRASRGGVSGAGCWRCGKTGHRSADCTAPPSTTQYDTSSSVCFHCGKLGHRVPTCPLMLAAQAQTTLGAEAYAKYCRSMGSFYPYSAMIWKKTQTGRDRGTSSASADSVSAPPAAAAAAAPTSAARFPVSTRVVKEGNNIYNTIDVDSADDGDA
jgi:hypothetical protein